MIKPNVVEGQIAGGTVQGIGGALLENMVYDDDGNPLSSTFVDYLLPTATEVPPIEYGHIEIPGPGGGGYKGVGEGGAIGSPPSVINASNDAVPVVPAQLREKGDATSVVIPVDLAMSGKAAEYARGLLAAFGENLIAQFTKALEADMIGGPPRAAQAASAATQATAAAA